MKNINKIAKEYSYRALKKGNSSVTWVTKDSDKDNGFDIISVEEGRKVVVGVKVTEGNKPFVITNSELQVMKKSPIVTYLIHRYNFIGGKLKDFNIYEYDKEKDLLVDELDNRNVCTLQSKVLDNGGISTTVYDCIPMKRKKIVK